MVVAAPRGWGREEGGREVDETGRWTTALCSAVPETPSSSAGELGRGLRKEEWQLQQTEREWLALA